MWHSILYIVSIVHLISSASLHDGSSFLYHPTTNKCTVVALQDGEKSKLMQLSVNLDAFMNKYNSSRDIRSMNSELIDMERRIDNKLAKLYNKMSLMNTKLCTPVVPFVPLSSTTTAVPTTISTTTQPPLAKVDCYGYYLDGARDSGVYTLYPIGLPIFDVYCDMETDGGGWTVIVNRDQAGIHEEFDRDWDQYKIGFGNLGEEFWIGNEHLHQMTMASEYEMRCDAESSDGTPNVVWGKWSVFVVGHEDDMYRLKVQNFDHSSTMQNSFGYNDDIQFTTKDVDNDGYGKNCASNAGGGFWYNRCSYNFPTATYGEVKFRPWAQDDARTIESSKLQLKIRPVRRTDIIVSSTISA